MRTIITIAVMSVLILVSSFSKHVEAAERDVSVMNTMCTLSVDQVDRLTNARNEDLPYEKAVDTLIMDNHEKELLKVELNKFYDGSFKDIAKYQGGINSRWLNYYTACTEHFQ